jgi:hypothetical protein
MARCSKIGGDRKEARGLFPNEEETLGKKHRGNSVSPPTGCLMKMREASLGFVI